MSRVSTGGHHGLFIVEVRAVPDKGVQQRLSQRKRLRIKPGRVFPVNEQRVRVWKPGASSKGVDQHLPRCLLQGGGLAQLLDDRRRQLAFAFCMIEQGARILAGTVFNRTISHLYSSRITIHATQASSQSVKNVNSPNEPSSNPLSRRTME
ncbi:hypothetical protein IFT99_12430 [Pseudomonas sp. CFBP 8772]|nr:hypothetical protein [Pseudomonas sp. CFBP 8772]